MNDQPPTSKIEPNKMLDTMLALVTRTVGCEAMEEGSDKVACRKMLLPLENGDAEPIEALADMMIEKPEEFNSVVDRFNNLVTKASDRAEEKVKAANGT